MMITDQDFDRRNVLLAGTTLAIASALAGSTTSVASAETSPLNPQPLPPSPDWARVMPQSPDARVKITEEYAKHVARDVYFWAWPMVNIYNRRLVFKDATEIMMSGPVPVAPLNHLGMLTDYIEPSERLVACPNQDVVYGAGSVALDQSPAVLQVPDFGDRFWVYQVVDLRTDSFVQLGKMYGTTPGFYLLVGPNWHGDVPKGITKVFRSSTNTGFIAPRMFQDDTPEDKRAIQGVLQQVMMYPLAEYDGTMKSKEKRYSLGTKNKTLKPNADGSLTIHVQADPPPEAQRANWLPAAKDRDFSLYVRAYWPRPEILDGSWTPPAVTKETR
jgi:hypothetical protein